MEFDLPAAYTEDAGNKPYMYQAHLTDYNMGLMVLMQGRKAGISDSRLKEGGEAGRGNTGPDG